MRFYDALQHQDSRERRLYLATDGGAAACKESLGFLITDAKGNPFIRCYGQPAGMNPQSFRSEICAALAALKLLYLYIKYFDERHNGETLSKQINLHIYTDSESMIKKLNAIREYSTAKYKMAMHPE